MGIGLEDDMGREEEVSCGGYLYFKGFIRISVSYYSFFASLSFKKYLSLWVDHSWSNYFKIFQLDFGSPSKIFRRMDFLSSSLPYSPTYFSSGLFCKRECYLQGGNGEELGTNCHWRAFLFLQSNGSLETPIYFFKIANERKWNKINK